MSPPPSISKSGYSRRQKACETCRRRKERCDGLQPCGRCRTRKVEAECRRRSSICLAQLPRINGLDVISELGETRNHESAISASGAGFSVPQPQAPITQLGSPSLTTISRNLSISSSLGSPKGITTFLTSRLIRDRQGAYMFLGPSANLSMLQCIRKIVCCAIGPCQFTEEPQQSDLVDEDPTISVNWNKASVEPQRPSATDAHYCLKWYTSATSCVFDLFGYEELTAGIIPWLESVAPADASSCINFLVLAIGAQCGPEDRDTQADEYFTYGRYLASTRFLETANISTVQIYSLIAMYLLNAARPNAASMHLGVAIRTAHSLGIHRPDISALFLAEENSHRERIWKGFARVGSLPEHTPWTTAVHHGDPIFEKILSEIYSKQEVSPTALEHVSQHHREWASHFREGLRVDRIPLEERISTKDGNNQLNIGLCHLKQAYYWTIMLVTRPYLIDLVQKHVAQDTNRLSSSALDDLFASSPQQSDTLLAHASVNSAVLSLDLLQGFLREEAIPKRLPYIINSILNAALVLGTGFFADLDHLFPLSNSIALAEKLLDRFQCKDPMARWSLGIVRELHNVCDEHVKRRRERRLNQQRALAEGLFGDVKACHSGGWPLQPSQLSPQSLPRGDTCPENGDLGMEELHFSGLDGDLRLEENNAIWSQLFNHSPSDPLFGQEMDSGGPLFDWT
ncbi:hypothetical protein N7457_003541 [Penicillium paradoxum]|uniref:uncharacterized protein n=1 Tax=Penicillium paradoxum TaxID=176176 RepID=UPI002548C38F|nr:uncharacterized protein N7457_003541 [Penicillium paradoxum]KAJ5788551.1 hypothetical protein N7457_003541 [Penicillium paradoxum]